MGEDLVVLCLEPTQQPIARRNRERRGKNLADIAERDARDTERDISPLRPAGDAIVFDTTDVNIDAMVEKMIRTVRDRFPNITRDR